MIASRRHHVDGALEAVKDVCLPAAGHFKRFVIVVSAMFAFSHIIFLLLTFILSLLMKNRSRRF
jgi:hypothetical protein